MTEPDLLKILRMDATQNGMRLFRNNTGTGWTGKIKRTTDGGVYINPARPLHSGLCKGSADLIGWIPVKITPEMVGSTVAVFAAVEAKTGRLKLTKEQHNFLDAVNSAGGVGIVARESDGKYILEVE